MASPTPAPETIVPSIDPIELGKWERFETEPSRARRFACGTWHNYVPRMFGFSISPLRLFLGSLRGLFFVAIVLLPIWAKVYEGTPESWDRAILVSAVLTVMLGFNFVYDRFIKDFKQKSVAKSLRRRLSLEVCGVTHGMYEHLKVRQKEMLPGIAANRKKILECIRDSARVTLGDYEGAHLEVALLLFDDLDATKIRIADRTTHSRPIGKVLLAKETMAYYVARSQKHRVVHDFLGDRHPFPKTSLSGGDKPNYRSVLFIPVIDTSSKIGDTCVGVVTVDSSKPYHFWPGNAEDLLLQLKPFLSMLCFFLKIAEANSLKLQHPVPEGSPAS